MWNLASDLNSIRCSISKDHQVTASTYSKIVAWKTRPFQTVGVVEEYRNTKHGSEYWGDGSISEFLALQA